MKAITLTLTVLFSLYGSSEGINSINSGELNDSITLSDGTTEGTFYLCTG